jgi:transposase
MVLPSVLRAVSKHIREAYNYSYRKISQLIQVSKTTIHRWLTCTSNTISPKKNNRDEIFALLQTTIKNEPCVRLKDLQRKLQTVCNFTISLSTICRYIRTLGITRKRLSIQLLPKQEETLKLKRDQFESIIKKYQRVILYL